MHIEGDTHIALALEQLFQKLDIDWEEHLSRFVGDVVAYKIGIRKNVRKNHNGLHCIQNVPTPISTKVRKCRFSIFSMIFYYTSHSYYLKVVLLVLIFKAPSWMLAGCQHSSSFSASFLRFVTKICALGPWFEDFFPVKASA